MEDSAARRDKVPAPLDRFNKNLRSMVERKNMKWTQLAKRAGMKMPAMRHYQTGDRWPSPENLEKIADALGCDFHELLSESPSSDTVEVPREEWEAMLMLRKSLRLMTGSRSVNSIYPCDSSFTANEHKLGSIHQYSAVSTSALSEGIDGPDIYFLGN